jgi:threonine/homoserine/homoserine lactone efflux protein
VSIAFWITTLVVVATPGTGVVYTIGTAFSRGARTALVAATGCTLGIVPHVVAATTGLAAIMHTSAVAFQTVKLAGVVYLLYLAWAVARDRSDLSVQPSEPVPTTAQVVGRGVLLNLLNPKLTIFFFAFLPQFAGDGQGSLPRMLALSGAFMLVTLVVFAGYGVFAASVRRHVLSRPAAVRWMRRGFASCYAVLAGRLALAAR